MTAGALRHRVTIQKLTIETDENGFEADTWTDFYSNYAEKNKLFGTERWAAAQVQADQSIRFTMRWHKKLSEVTPKWYRLMCEGKAYTITNVDPVMFRNDVVKIDTIEVEA